MKRREEFPATFYRSKVEVSPAFGKWASFLAEARATHARRATSRGFGFNPRISGRRPLSVRRTSAIYPLFRDIFEEATRNPGEESFLIRRDPPLSSSFEECASKALDSLSYRIDPRASAVFAVA